MDPEKSDHPHQQMFSAPLPRLLSAHVGVSPVYATVSEKKQENGRCMKISFLSPWLKKIIKKIFKTLDNQVYLW